MIPALYAVVILIATTLGSFVGLGGGVIIKPALDFIGHDARTQVDFFSCCAVFTMSIVSLIKAIIRKQKFKVDIVIFLAFGSVCGGWAGTYAVNELSTVYNENLIRCIQAFTLSVLISAVVFYVKKCNFSFNFKNPVAKIVIGLCLGFVASFLGIGGGPVNVAVLLLFFSLDTKESTIYSIAILFFSQLTKLIVTASDSGLSIFSDNAPTLAIILPAAVIGGFIGSFFYKKFSENVIKNTFSVAMVLIVCLNIYNGIRYLSLL